MSPPPRARWFVVALVTGVVLLSAAAPAVAQEAVDSGSGTVSRSASGQPAAEPRAPWWVWPLVLFVFCFVLGILAVVAGVGGGVLYVPLVAGFFPFHIDFVRGSGLLIGLAGALAAAPGLLKRGLTTLRVVLPCALMASVGSLLGAKVGLRMEAEHVQLALGLCMIGVLVLMLVARSAEFPTVGKPDRLSRWLALGGTYREPSLDLDVRWHAHRLPTALPAFVGVGFLGGVFGLGAGWANVPMFNLVMGLPLKMAVASSVMLISVSNATAAWEYLNHGAWLPVMAIPSVVGLMLGTGVGVKVLHRSRPRSVRYVVLVVLAFAAVRSVLKGVGLWQ